MTTMRRLETPRRALEPLVAAHAEAMFEVLSDPAIYAFENAPPASLQWLHERYAKLETRLSADGREQWLNWVLRVRGGALIGYVQATIEADASAWIAYESASAFWGRGLAGEAVQAMIDELASHYGVHTLRAMFKRANVRSLRLLQRLQFAPAPDEDAMRFDVPADEALMHRPATLETSSR